MTIEAIGRVFYIDSTYDTENHEVASGQLKAELEKELGGLLEPVDIGAEADWPAWLLNIRLEEFGVTAVALGALFAGERIEKSIFAWCRVASKIKAVMSRPAKLDRNAAFSLALDYLLQEYKLEEVKEVRLLDYRQADSRFERFQDARSATNDVSFEYQGQTIHVFEIEIDAINYLVGVKGRDIASEVVMPEP